MATDATYSRQRHLPGRESERGGAQPILALFLLLVAGLAFFVLLATFDLVELSKLGRVALPLQRLIAHLDATVGVALSRLAIGASAGVVGLSAVALALHAASTGEGSSNRRHVLSADDNGLVVIDARGIANVAAAAARRTPGLLDVNVRVVGRGAAPVGLAVRAWVSAATEQKRVGDDVRRKSAEAVRKLVGIEVSEVLVKLEVVPLEDLDSVLD